MTLYTASIPDPSTFSVCGLINPERIFFIVGHPKSGTTWLQKILNEHPQICCKLEGHFFSRNDGYNTLSDALRSSQSLRAWSARTFNFWSDNFDIDVLYYCKLIVQFYLQREAQRTGKQIIGDKSPSYQLQEMAILFPHAKVIHIIRDGRDVSVSMAFHRSQETNRYMTTDMTKKLDQLIGGKMPSENVIGLPDDYIAHSAKIWKEEVQTCRTQGFQLFAENYFEVTYEQLHQNSEVVLKNILNFLNAVGSSDIITDCLKKCDFKVISGRDKGQQDNKSFFRKGIIGDWENVFRGNNLPVFMNTAGDLLKDLGYL